MPQGAGFSGDRGGQMQRGPRKTCFAGNSRGAGENGSGKEISRLPPDRGRFCGNAGRHRALPPGKVVQSGQAPTAPCRSGKVVQSRQAPTTPCLPCVRGGAERMRSGGVVGNVQKKVPCNRKPVPIRHPQPLSQGLRPCQLPLHRGAKPCGGFSFAGAKPCGGRSRPRHA